jgi:hypothetical protein
MHVYRARDNPKGAFKSNRLHEASLRDVRWIEVQVYTIPTRMDWGNADECVAALILQYMPNFKAAEVFPLSNLRRLYRSARPPLSLHGHVHRQEKHQVFHPLPRISLSPMFVFVLALSLWVHSSTDQHLRIPRAHDTMDTATDHLHCYDVLRGICVDTAYICTVEPSASRQKCHDEWKTERQMEREAIDIVS